MADKNITTYNSKSRYCGVCGQAGHNSHTCNSNEPNDCENIGAESLTKT
ncbi:27464_t:CDS:2, partial [Dentiscutata erythropus]